MKRKRGTRTPYTDRTETMVFRLSVKTKDKLEKLAQKGKYGSNKSEVLRLLIERAYRW